MGVNDLPYANGQPGRPCPKGESRLQITVKAKKLDVINEATFKKTVRERDRMRCRKCGRKVIVTLARVPERAECHHLHGRVGDLQFEDRCAICLCSACHELCTGRVNEKWIVVAKKSWLLHGQKVMDARGPLTFERIA